jgi:hypothetical protein
MASYIPSSAYGGLGPQLALSTQKPSRLLVRLKLVAGPQSPVVEVAPRLRLLQESARIKDPVVGLKPEVAIRLPSDLSRRHPQGSVSTEKSSRQTKTHYAEGPFQCEDERQ